MLVNLSGRLDEIQLKEVLPLEMHTQYIFVPYT